jgi:flagellar biosynthesis/type III secretory pathway chaperone
LPKGFFALLPKRIASEPAMSTKTLAQMLQKDLINATNLENLLRLEREQLEQRNIAALSALLLQKAEILADIELNDDHRRKLLASAGLPADNRHLHDYCKDIGLDALYEQLQQQFRKCAELTDINGAIVHRSRLNNRQILDILQGKNAQSSVYTSHGDTNKTSESRALAKA